MTHYRHRQAGWATRIVLAACAAGVVWIGAPTSAHGPDAAVLGAAALLALCAFVFGTLTVRVGERRIDVAYGFGWPARSVDLVDVLATELTRSRWYEGWGIRYTTRGWLWNASGLDAVLLRLPDGRNWLVGSDDAAQLRAAIEQARALSLAASTSRSSVGSTSPSPPESHPRA